MGIINGSEFISRLNGLNNEIWLDGKRIEGKVSEHPAFKGVIKSKAALFDLQHDPTLIDELTFISPSSGNRVGLSFLRPKTKEDLIKRRKMVEHWARQSLGTMGRSPDYLNTVIMSFATSAHLLADAENCFPHNLVALYELAMENDLTFTHTFISPQVNRSQFYVSNSKEPIAATIIDTNADGIVVKGAMLLATQGGLTDEVLVFSIPSVLTELDKSFAFSIPSNTKGLRFICRSSFVGGESVYDHPLSSQYEEMDSIVVFDEVLVPWNRVFYYNNLSKTQFFVGKSSFSNFTIHQVMTRQIVKTEFILGLAELLIRTINVSEYQHVQEKVSEIIVGLETMKALLEKAENDAELDAFGTMRPNLTSLKVASNLFPKLYPRFMEIIQLIGASGMISIPPEKAFHSPIRSDLDLYLQGTSIPGEERVKIFRLAWDLTMSAFGTRQTQYERFFYGDPVRLAGDLYKFYPKDRFVNTVVDYLDLS